MYLLARESLIVWLCVAEEVMRSDLTLKVEWRGIDVTTDRARKLDGFQSSILTTGRIP